MVRSVVLVVCVAACGFRGPLAGSDAPDAELILEAEADSSTTKPAAHQWSVATDVAGYTGAGFMQCLPDNGVSCAVLAQVPLCAASLVYAVTIAQPGSYFFHVRTLARTRTQDSLWYGLDGVIEPSSMDVPEDGAWHWSTGASFALTAGPHTLHVWQREAGVRIDRIALTTSATPPP